MNDKNAPLPPDVAPPTAEPSPEAQQAESDVWLGTPCFRAEIGRLLIAAGATIGIILLAILLQWGWLWAIHWVPIVAVWAWALLSAAWPRWANGFRLTSQRLFARRGLIRQVTDQTELIRVDDVRVRQGIIQRYLNVGDVLIVSTDSSDPLLVLDSIASPHDAASTCGTAESSRTMSSSFERVMGVSPLRFLKTPWAGRPCHGNAIALDPGIPQLTLDDWPI